MDVIWKDVVGYEGIYEVSSTGLVRTHKDKTTYTERHGVRKWKQRVLKHKVAKDNSCRVSLWKNGKEKTILLHRIVAYAFIPLVEGKEFVNHMDGDRLNNAASNLEWCTYTENTNHAFDNGLISTNNKVLLMDIKTNEIHYFRSMTKAAEFLGKNHGYVSGKILKGETEFDGYTVFTQPKVKAGVPA